MTTWKIKRVIAKRNVAPIGQQYLVEWEPTWERAADVSRSAIKEFESNEKNGFTPGIESGSKKRKMPAGISGNLQPPLPGICILGACNDKNGRLRLQVKFENENVERWVNAMDLHGKYDRALIAYYEQNVEFVETGGGGNV